MADNWCTIESDPGIFTELLEEIGVSGVQVEELWSMDPESLDFHGEIYGLIFLFKWDANVKDEAGTQEMAGENHDILFLSQVITNACASQALLSVILNHDDINAGAAVNEFKTFVECMDAELAGASLSNFDLLKQVHNSFARPEPFIMEQRVATQDDDVFHFVAYMPKNGTLYQLDGLRPGPVNHGPFEGKWTDKAAAVIQERISLYMGNEIRFNLLALVRDKRQIPRARIVNLKAEAARVASRITELGGTPEMSAFADAEIDTLGASTADADLPEAEVAVAAVDVAAMDQAALEAALEALAEEVVQARGALSMEQMKREGWRKENVRRRHNYIPFIVGMLKKLAEKGELQGLIDRAKDKALQSQGQGQGQGQRQGQGQGDD